MLYKKFGDYQIQVGEVYSTSEGYRVWIDVSKEILTIKIRWKAVNFMPSSSARFELTDSERFYPDLVQIIKKIQSKSYLDNQSTTWWKRFLRPLEGEYIYLGNLSGIDISISKNDPEKCEINDTFLPTEVLIRLIKKISKDSHPDTQKITMIHRFDSYTLFYPQNQAFIRGESRLPECLMIVDGTYRAFQMPILFVIGIILIPFILAQGLIQLAKAVNIWNLPQVAMLIQFAGFGMSGLALLNLLSTFSNPLLFKWIETLWAKQRSSKIIQNGGEVIDGWVFNVKEDSDKDWFIEFKTSQESTANIYSITIPHLPDHLSHLENGSVLKFLRNNNCLFML